MGSICSTTPEISHTRIVPSFESYTREQALGAPSQQITERSLSNCSLDNIPEDATQVISELERRGEIEAKKVFQSSATSENTANALLGIMQSGATEFEKRTGRPMTYAEMRAAWG